MLESVILSFLTGIIFGNGIPHFVRGITKERYPSMFGNSPTPNLIGGWICFVVSGLLAKWIDFQQFEIVSLISASVGLLIIGLFHASIGAFGRND